MKKSSLLSTLLITFVMLLTLTTGMPGASEREPRQEVTTARSLAAKWQWMMNQTTGDDAFTPDQFGGLTAGNAIYRVHVQNNPLLGTGLYTFTTGPEHPAGPGQNILFGDGVPTTSFNTIRSYTSDQDYVPVGLLALIPGTRSISLSGTVAPIGLTGFRTTYRLTDQPDELTIISEINVNGTQFEDSFIEVATTVINNGSAPVAIGIRYLWDFKIAEDDGPTFQERNPDGAVRRTEASFPAPPAEQYQIQDNDINPGPPTFSVFGTISGPKAMKPARPDVLQFACWTDAVRTPFGYRVEPTRDITTDGVPCQQEGVRGGDSAVLYFFGSTRETALIIPPGGMQKVSASLGSTPSTGPTPTGTVLGTVRNASTNQSIAGATLAVANTSLAVTSGSDGTYVINGVPAGQQVLMASAAGFIPTQVMVTVPANQTVLQDISLVPVSEGTVQGIVRNAANGQPIAGATVSIANRSTTSGSDGAYTLSNVPVGQQILTASAPGFISTQVTVTVVANQTVTQNISLSPELPTGEIRITLNWTKDASGQPDDLDMHLTGPQPNGSCFHVFYLNLGSLDSPPFAQLEVDNIQLPNHPPTETIRLSQLTPGIYRFYVHNFSGERADGVSQSRATVQVFSSRGLVFSQTAPAGVGLYWTVFTLDGRTGSITLVNQLSNTEPSPTPCQ